MRGLCLSLIVAAIAVGMAGCATPPPGPPPSPSPEDFGLAAAGPASRGAVLRAGLAVSIVVLVSGQKEIEEPAKRVSDQGDITLPLLGVVHVEGLTPEDLVGVLTTRYAEYFKRPQVVVDFLRDSGPESGSPWGYVTVLGRVVKPGRISIPPTRDLTVSGAIQQAGGLNTSALDTAIRISRRQPDGGMSTREINLKAVGARGAVDQDLVLLSGDVVFVPERIF